MIFLAVAVILLVLSFGYVVYTVREMIERLRYLESCLSVLEKSLFVSKNNEEKCSNEKN